MLESSYMAGLYEVVALLIWKMTSEIAVTKFQGMNMCTFIRIKKKKKIIICSPFSFTNENRNLHITRLYNKPKMSPVKQFSGLANHKALTSNNPRTVDR